jgi:biopolymer transport protein TolQ
MTDLTFLAAAISGTPGRIDPIKLFLDADIVVQVVMAGLLLASVWVWMIIVSFRLRLASVNRSCENFEEDFWLSEQPEKLLGDRRKNASPSAAVAAAGLAEFHKSTKQGKFDKFGTSQRVALAMEGKIAEEADGLAARLNFLATTGAVAPFVGLFGTVWGIMNSFFQIGQQQNSSLAVVAPGISEALFATAIGLFAAIPAVIAYNRYSHSVNTLEARLQRFADKFHAQLSREMEQV